MSQAPITEGTTVAGNLRGFLVLAGAILSGGIAAGAGATRLMQRVSALEEKVGALPTKEDLRAAVGRHKAVFVLCPGKRPDAWVECKAVTKGDDEP